MTLVFQFEGAELMGYIFSSILLMWNGETITGAAALISLNKGRFFP